ncbi:MAG TPA: hypothetical protein VLL76_05480 [Candidatus Omnitrophota bacterium]|nr:hypothetical protein [Candidatus Omnitrophota bacterium]
MEGDIPPDELAAFEAYRERVKGTNISGSTLLATDYLNHFNEIVMLLDMLPEMPDMIEECKLWEPKGYKAHFADSSFSDKELAIDAYDRVPTKFRRPFEETIRALNLLLMEGITRLDQQIAEGADADMLRESCKAISRAAQTLMDCASSIIHGSDRAMAQAEIDGLLGR